MSYSPLLTFVLYLFHGLMLLYICFHIHSTLPRGFSLPLLHFARVYLISYSSPFIFVFYPSLGFMLLCILSAISIHSPPRIVAPSLTYRTYLPTLSFPYYSAWLPPTTTYVHHVLFHLHISLFPFSCPTYTPSTFPTHTITVFTTQFNPFPSQALTPPHLMNPSV